MDKHGWLEPSPALWKPNVGQKQMYRSDHILGCYDAVV